jgi:SAM-dependent methyltransferase
VRNAIRFLHLSYREFIFVDLGSGKGRTLLVAAEFPFRRIIGVDIASDLNLIALENVASCRGLGARRSCIDVVSKDAGDFEFPDDPLVLFMFNPFPAAVLSRVMENLVASLVRVPRQAFLIYRKPICADVIESSSCFSIVVQSKSWLTPDDSLTIYRSRCDAAPAVRSRATGEVTL